mgnify:CR=1 FL=1
MHPAFSVIFFIKMYFNTIFFFSDFLHSFVCCSTSYSLSYIYG